MMLKTAVSLLLLASASALPLINEYQPNPPGSDNDTLNDDQVELKGTPNQSFTYCLINVECDADAGNGGPGRVDEVATVTGTFDANGLAVVSLDPNPEHD